MHSKRNGDRFRYICLLRYSVQRKEKIEGIEIARGVGPEHQENSLSLRIVDSAVRRIMHQNELFSVHFFNSGRGLRHISTPKHA